LEDVSTSGSVTRANNSVYDLELFKLLLKTGVPLSSGISPIFNAITGAWVEILSFILNLGKNQDINELKIFMEKRLSKK